MIHHGIIGLFQSLKKESLMKTFSQEYLTETVDIISKIDCEEIENIVEILNNIKENGRLFILGVGGSAGTASHAVNDFRKICGIEAYTPTDNVSELTARTNDEGWDTTFVEYLKTSKLTYDDILLILSVGGGSLEKNISMNLVKAIDYAKWTDAKVLGIVGRDGGYTKLNSDACVVIPTASQDLITPHTEGLCSVVLHLIVSHPLLKNSQTKWESVK
jgi:D-sedoheptulose 7-phosphate isomerase